jgi:hypothetical protein
MVHLCVIKSVVMWLHILVISYMCVCRTLREKTLIQCKYFSCFILNCKRDSTHLTFKNRASYILDGRTATLQMLHFIYFFNKYKY